MLILIIETSSEQGCLVLADKAQVLASTKLEGAISKTIAKELKNLLSNQIPDLIAVGIGPGSYTGTRVGVALAKALAYGWKVPCLGFCSLKAFGPPPILKDARGGGVYAWFGEKVALSPKQDACGGEVCAWFGEKTALLPKQDPRIQGLSLSVTPPDPNLLAGIVWDQFSEEGAPPFSLDYCTVP